MTGHNNNISRLSPISVDAFNTTFPLGKENKVEDLTRAVNAGNLTTKNPSIRLTDLEKKVVAKTKIAYASKIQKTVKNFFKRKAKLNQEIKASTSLPGKVSGSAPGKFSAITGPLAIKDIMVHVKNALKHKDPESILLSIAEVVKLPMAFIRGVGGMSVQIASLVGVASIPTAVTAALGIAAGVAMATALTVALPVLGFTYLGIEAIRAIGNLIADATFTLKYKPAKYLNLLQQIETKNMISSDKTRKNHILGIDFHKYNDLLSEDSRGLLHNFLYKDEWTENDVMQLKGSILYDAMQKLMTEEVDNDSTKEYKALYLTRRLGVSAGSAMIHNFAEMKKTARKTLLNKRNVQNFTNVTMKNLKTANTQQKKMIIIHSIGIAVITLSTAALILSLALAPGIVLPGIIIGIAIGALGATQTVLSKTYLEHTEDKIDLRLLIPKVFTQEKTHTPLRARLWTDQTDKKKKTKYILLSVFSLGIAPLIDTLKGSPLLKKLRKNLSGKESDDFGDSLKLRVSYPRAQNSEGTLSPSLIKIVKKMREAAMTDNPVTNPVEHAASSSVLDILAKTDKRDRKDSPVSVTDAYQTTHKIAETAKPILDAFDNDFLREII